MKKLLIFLDIDGVIKSVDQLASAKSIKKNHPLLYKDEFGDIFDERCVNWLRYLVESSRADIVISSSWRKTLTLDGFIKMWQQRNLPGNVVGITPVYQYKVDGKLFPGVKDDRTREILQWWFDNQNKHFPTLFHYETVQYDDYIAIDDHQLDMCMTNNFIQTDPTYGLTYMTAEKAYKLLLSKK